MKDKEKQKTQETKELEAEKKELEQLQETIEKLQKEKEELFGKLQRVSADYANFQKRVPKQISDTIAYEKEKIIRTLLPALDNFEHTLQNMNSVESIDVLEKGIRIIYDQVLDILKSHGVEQIKALGEKFDPSFHEAVMQKTEPEKDDDIILEEFQKGYKLNDRVIRPSKVIVNKLVLKQAEQEKEEPSDETTGGYETIDEYETKDTE